MQDFFFFIKYLSGKLDTDETLSMSWAFCAMLLMQISHLYIARVNQLLLG